MNPLIKICGIRELEHAVVAADAEANLIGFVFVPVKREVSPGDAKRVIDSVRSRSDLPPAAVGLFVNDTAERINAVSRNVGLDLIQLSGNESPELASEIELPVIKAIRIEDGESLDDVRLRIRDHLRFSDAVVIDSHVAGRWGGTGVVGDWHAAAQLAAEFPVMLAGGLNPRNVAEAIDRVRPAVIDVSSGVESDGRKDTGKIREFVEAARSRQLPIKPSSPASQFMEMIGHIQEQRAASRV